MPPRSCAADERRGYHQDQGSNEAIPLAPPPASLEVPDRSRPNGLAIQETTQVVGELTGGAIMPQRMFLQTLQTNGVQIVGDG